MNVADKLVEIYTSNKNSFSVGIPFYCDGEWEVFKNIDTRGVVDGYYLIKKSCIKSKQSDTDYLKMLSLYLKYANDHPYNQWFELEDIAFAGDVLNQVITMASKEQRIITIKTSKSNNLYEGYIGMTDNAIQMKCINISNACFLDDVVILPETVEWIEFCSLEQRLLEYANKSM